MRAPCEHGTPHQSVKEKAVDGFEDLFQVVIVTHMRVNLLAAARLSRLFRLAAYRIGLRVAAVAIVVECLNRLLVELGEKDVRDGLQNGGGSTFKQVRETYMEAAFAQTDRGIQGNKSTEFDLKRGHGRTRPKIAIRNLKDLLQFQRCHCQ